MEEDIYPEAYLRLFFEGIPTPENPYKKVVKFEERQFKDFYSSIYKIEKGSTFDDILSDRYVNIVVEAASEVNFNQPVLDLILDARFGQQIMPEEILGKLNKNWMFYEQFRDNNKGIPLYVFKFDFNDDKSILKMFWILCPSLRKKDGSKIAREFKMNCGSLDGFTNDLGNAVLLCLNGNSNKSVVAHELCHYFQDILGILEPDEKNITASSGIPELNLTKEKLKSLLGKKEFYPTVSIDMATDFKKFWKISYPELSKEEFMQSLRNEIDTYQNNILYSSYCKKFEKTIGNSSSLQLLAALKHLRHRYEEAMDLLSRSFRATCNFK